RRALDRIGWSLRSALGLEPARPKELRLHDDAVQWIAEIVSDDAEHVIASLDGSPGGAMQASILEGESCPSSKLLRNAQVLGAIHARLDGRQEERPQTLVTQAERHPDDGPWTDGLEPPKVLVVLGERRQHLCGQVHDHVALGLQEPPDGVSSPSIEGRDHQQLTAPSVR